MITITIRDTDKLAGKLNANFGTIFRPAMTRSVLLLEAYMKEYPPQPGGSEYRRTGTLGRRWTHTIAMDSNSARGTIGNNTSYGPFVQSASFQARVHRGHWQTDQDSVTDNEPRIVEFFEDAIEGYFR